MYIFVSRAFTSTLISTYCIAPYDISVETNGVIHVIHFIFHVDEYSIIYVLLWKLARATAEKTFETFIQKDFVTKCYKRKSG